ncbi:MAG: hypothetical protein KDD35_12675 [Bdellovibrionales bacterium]|nr:hypothetical protein [Bdellovibrionales bacterium]
MNWLSLNDYSIKHRVSVSTLRRRIKQDSISFIFKDGKYWINDDTKIEPKRELKPKWHSETRPKPLPPPPVEKGGVDQGMRNLSAKFESTVESLLQEIKRAYAVILQEKEEQILLLKEEVVDLRTLVRVLEENLGVLNIKLKNLESQKPKEVSKDWNFSLDK